MSDKIVETVRDNPNVVEVYSNRVVNMTYDGAAVVLTLAAARAMPERLDDADAIKTATLNPTAVVNNRLALPAATVIDMYNSLGEIVAHIRKQRGGNPDSGRSTN